MMVGSRIPEFAGILSLSGLVGLPLLSTLIVGDTRQREGQSVCAQTWQLSSSFPSAQGDEALKILAQ
jgi:hypothetical protein